MITGWLSTETKCGEILWVLSFKMSQLIRLSTETTEWLKGSILQEMKLNDVALRSQFIS